MVEGACSMRGDDVADGQRKGMGREMGMWMDVGMCRWWCGCVIDMWMVDGEVEGEVEGEVDGERTGMRWGWVEGEGRK